MKKKQQQGRPSQLIVKSNHLIEARYKLNVVEQKLILVLISKLQPQDETFRDYTFRVDELAPLLGLELKHAYDEIKQTTKSLVGRVLQIYSEEERRLLQVSWLSSADYHEDKGIVDLRISEKLKPYLLQLKQQFKAYPLKEVLQFKHTYSFRFYELLKQYETLGERELELSELKEMLSLVKGQEYDRFFDFEKRVIIPSIEEINEKSDLEITYEKVKRGRAVHTLSFTIDYKSELDEAQRNLSEDQRKVFKQGLKLKIERVVLVSYLKEYSVERVREALNVVKEQKKLGNPSGLFIEAIRNNWKPLLL